MDAVTVDHKPYYVQPGFMTRIGAHFGPRLSEWSGSANMLILGAIYLTVDGVFDQATYVYINTVFGLLSLPLNLAPQLFVGAVLFVAGLFGFIGLTINGMRKEVTPWIRVSRAIVGFWIFTGISTCFVLSGVLGPWLAWYPVAAAVELVNMFRSSNDAGDAYNDTTRRK
jgi:hypothetical protein